jgi:hypothetical protein
MAPPTFDEAPKALVGCLIDVSNSMRNVLDTGEGDERVVERLRAVFHAALKMAQAEERRHPNALMFVGAFGLAKGNSPIMDICSVIDALVDADETWRDGHDLLISLANEHQEHVTQYIRTKLSDD